MIGVLIVSHGRLAAELRSAMEHVVGPQTQVETVCINADDDIEMRRREIGTLMAGLDSGEGVLVLTDMFGGTPSNLAISQANTQQSEVISGVNLPMLVKLAKVRVGNTLSECVSCAQKAGRKYIAAASDIMPRCKKSDHA